MPEAGRKLHRGTDLANVILFPRARIVRPKKARGRPRDDNRLKLELLARVEVGRLERAWTDPLLAGLPRSYAEAARWLKAESRKPEHQEDAATWSWLQKVVPCKESVREWHRERLARLRREVPLRSPECSKAVVEALRAWTPRSA